MHHRLIAKISVAAPVKVTAPTGFVDTTRQALVYGATADSNTTTSSSVGTALWDNPAIMSTSPLNITPGNHTLKVGMNAGQVTGSTPPPAGVYQYKVTLTATPN
ncbi:hypothetical protein F7734_23000 [Scytonema sp. UIC 10036]|uniref:hypothetical protein n=1 Tax=Scytonema sp. UIC 10036 TaxID=2304196 RepID=UPI0012DA3023|nr:hypothetical protein [Scytonema sp. UIC 10036]MUG95075.1 hypothetical protein [Scytonema sp. UIC 10036]